MTIDELLGALAGLPQGAIVPNAEQRAVMEHTGGPLWVIAGPGTGKTQGLVLRTLRLLCVDGVAPEAVVLTTFTRKAAEQLEHRLHEILRRLARAYPEVGQIDLGRMHLGTMHSICWELLTDSPASRYRHLHLLDELEQVFFIQTASRFCTSATMDESATLDLLAWAECPDQPVRPTFLPARWKRAQVFLGLLQRVIEDQVDLDRLVERYPALGLLRELIAEYRQALEARHFLDYTLLQQQTLTWLTSSEGQAFVRGSDGQAGIQHVIVDEYQDSNPLQAALYRALAAVEPHTLCVVGDDDQALYRFRGGTVTCMVRFAEECAGAWPGCPVRQVALTQTYRSHPGIVNWINGFITNQAALKHPGARVPDKPTLVAARPGRRVGTAVWAIRGKNMPEVATAFAHIVSDLCAQGTLASPSQCALLAYSVKDATISPFRSALQTHNIQLALPAVVRDHPVYQLVVGTLLDALDPYELALPTHPGDTDFSAYVEHCRSKCRQDAFLVSVARQLHSWLTTDSDARYRQPLGNLVDFILNAPACAALIEREESALRASHALKRIVDAFDRIVEQGRASIPFDTERGAIQEGWLARIYLVLARTLHAGILTEADQSGLAASEMAALPALTIHGAKGLEFPVVAVVVGERGSRADRVHQLERAVVPFRRDLNGARGDPLSVLAGDDDLRAAQDIVRLHYVAYSRARDLLLLLVPDSRWAEPPAVGLGGDRAWFGRYVQEWPPAPKQRGKPAHPARSTEGEVTHGFWDI
jgi:DNA helicase-2/ATP-dependent DNA helicase PcrA